MSLPRTIIFILGMLSRQFFLVDYVEDEIGNELTLQEAGELLTGNPNVIHVPSGTKQHDLDFMLSEKTPPPIAEVSLDENELRLLAYFTRDYRELITSAFMQGEPISLHSDGDITKSDSNPTLETAITDEEIRSFLTIFRRFYMEKEPANIQKAIEIFVKVMNGHPYGNWANGVLDEYDALLTSIPKVLGSSSGMSVTFSIKRLIDVYIYTRFAHQPSEKRERQYKECLSEVNNKGGLLTWMFLSELRNCSSIIHKAGRVIAGWFHSYCEHHKITPDFLNSLLSEHPGIGAAEKEATRNARLFQEKVEALAKDLWKQKDYPEGGTYPVSSRS